MRIRPAITRPAVEILVGLGTAAELDGLRELETLDLPGKPLSQPGIGFLDLVTVVELLAKHAVLVANAVAQPAHQELERQVTYAPAMISLHRHPGLTPAFHHAVARGVYHGLVQERRLGAYRAPPEHAPEIMCEILEDGIRGHRQGRCLQQFDLADTDSLVRACGHDFLRQPALSRGLSIRVASGGIVTLSACGFPRWPTSSGCSSPLPIPLPPNMSASVFMISSNGLASDTPMR